MIDAWEPLSLPQTDLKGCQTFRYSVDQVRSNMSTFRVTPSSRYPGQQMPTRGGSSPNTGK